MIANLKPFTPLRAIFSVPLRLWIRLGLTLLLSLGLALLAVLLTPHSAHAARGPLYRLGRPEGAVSIVAWAGYIERGETDPAYDWVTGFEKETGCKVSVKVAATSDEMVALMNEGALIW